MSRKIFAEKDNYNCIVYMSIKLVLRYFKLFILFFTYILSTLTCWILYTYTCTIKNNDMYHTWKLTATIWHFCQKNLY